MTSKANDLRGPSQNYSLGYSAQLPQQQQQLRPHNQYSQQQQQPSQPFHQQQPFHPQGMQLRHDNMQQQQQQLQQQLQQQQRISNQYISQQSALPYNTHPYPQQQQLAYDGYDNNPQQGSQNRYRSPGHQGQSTQQPSGQTPVEHGSASTSVSESSPPRSEIGSNLRIKISLEAQTAALQRQDETPVTYLNKGQFYAVALKDTEEHDGDITSVIRVTFHDASHRRLAARYWSFWLSQQPTPKTARALDIEKASSSGMMEIQSKTFDRISFKWNGKLGAKLMVRFNCLSTDFSRIKGVKGIPLRVHMDTLLEGIGGTTTSTSNTAHGDQQSTLERSFAKIKLFRDKGAERKNKDDHKHLEKMWDKMRGKNADTNPLVSMLAPVQTVSMFSECVDLPEGSGDEEDGQDQSENLDENTDLGGGTTADATTTTPASSTSSKQDQLASSSTSSSSALVSKKRRRLNEATVSNNNNSSQSGSTAGLLVGGSHQAGCTSTAIVGVGAEATGGSQSLSTIESNSLFIDRDANYVPHQHTNKRRPVLCLYIKIGGESVYRAVYLEKFTLADLVQKLSEKLEIQASTISSVYRKTIKKELLVKVDDAMVGHMGDEMDMVVDYDFNQLDGSVNLTLKY
ncbi:grainyhead-like [Mortierella sp. GBA30]|nr:grainyhead-like [Mortierella sp. GBA30]